MMKPICAVCGKEKKVFSVKKDGPNKGRLFANCFEHGQFEWMPASIGTFNSAEAKIQTTSAATEGLSVPMGAGVTSGIGLNFLKKQDVTSEVKPEFVPSSYQSTIFDFVREGSGNGVVEAVAGSGKTTTLVKALEFTPASSKVGFVAFNKHIAAELQERAPSHVHVSTLHSLGYKNVRSAFPNAKLDEYKLSNLFDDIDAWGQHVDEKPNVSRLVNLLKATLKDPSQDSLQFLVDRYGIEVNSKQDDVFELAAELYQRSTADTTTLDFEDMIFWCATNKVQCEQFDFLFGDEWQDTNLAQQRMALNSLRPGGRALVVGDKHQSIYGFRGADVDAIPNAISELQAQSMPLSVCYRCPKSAILLAQQFVPHIEWRPDAPDGLVQNLSALPKLQPGDLVLCRTNAPLVKPCFDLIRQGVKATIRGRDIGNGLVSMLNKGESKTRTKILSAVMPYLESYVQAEVAKLLKANKGTRASGLQDQLETLWAIGDGSTTTGEVKRKIQSVFSDAKAAVNFSSVHRAKGDEANNVYILEPGKMPHPMAKQDWEIEQERNLMYVAYTRTKQTLSFVG